MTQIIGHRGAAGLALENTIEAFTRAIKAGVRVVELDVHATKDGQFVVAHDPNLRRVSGVWAQINQLDYAELQKIVLRNGESLPLLTTVLDLVRDNHCRAVVELKANRELAAFCGLISTYEQSVQAVASANYDILIGLRKLNTSLKLYVIERLNPFAALHKAKMVGASGIDLNFWLLNPLTYWLARRAKLEFMVYTINRDWLQRFVSRLYPMVAICTDVPDKFLTLTAAAVKRPR